MILHHGISNKMINKAEHMTYLTNYSLLTSHADRAMSIVIYTNYIVRIE